MVYTRYIQMILNLSVYHHLKNKSSISPDNRKLVFEISILVHIALKHNDMHNPFQNKTFKERTSGLRYSFTQTDMAINSVNNYKGKYQLYEEGDNVYLNTSQPPLSSDDFLVTIFDNVIILTYKNDSSRVQAHLVDDEDFSLVYLSIK